MNISSACLGLWLALMAAGVLPAPPAPAAEAVRVGQAYPGLTFPAPQDPAHRKYLGLRPGQELNPAALPARVVILEVFNTY